MITASLIEKETVDRLVFPATEVLNTIIDREARTRHLRKATALGNLNKFKVYILFEDEEGMKTVYTTIWAITEKKIILKAGRSIPRNRVHSVEFV